MKNLLPRFALSMAQRDIWIDQTLNPGLAIYNIGGYVKIRGEVDVKLFETAINALIKRHDALRLVLDTPEVKSGLPLQYFLPSLSITIPVVDFSDAGPKEAIAWMQKRFVEPYELIGEPLFRFDLLKIDENEYWWLAQYHHLVTDGWSGALLTRSLAEIYTSLLCGEEINHEAPLFEDYLYSESKYIDSAKFEKDRSFWLNQYKSVPPSLLDPSSKRLSEPPSEEGGCHTFFLSRLIFDRLNNWAKERNVSVFHIILASLALYFGRCSNQNRLIFGLPILNRSNAEFRQTAGLFAGIIPVLFDIDFEESVSDFVTSIGAQLRRHYRHQRFPIGEVNRGIDEINGVDRSQLFDVSVNYAKQSHDVLFGENQARSIMLDANVSQTPLAISVWEFNEGEDVQVDFSYNQDFYSAEDVASIESCFIYVIEQFLGNPESCLKQVQILDVSQRDIQLKTWNATKAAYPQDSCIHELFEAQVAKSPEAIALTFEDQQLTYGELNQKANQLAHYLVTEKQVVPDTLVGICLERSLDMVVAILGILKAGGAYVPLDPDYPEARLSYMLQDSGANTVITHRELLDRTPISPDNAVCLDVSETQDNIAAQATSSPDIQTLNSRHLAYVIYTSGSTGNPKGVMVEHQAIVNRIHWMHTHYGAASRDVFLQKTPFSFDVSVWEFFWPLMAGSQLVIAQPQGHTDPQYLSTLIQAQGVTKLHFVPSMLSAMLVAGTFEACHSVKQVFCSGEALALQHERDFYRVLPESELHNLYGPTEAAVDVSYWACSEAGSGHSSVPIGRPIDNIQLHVLDSHCQLVPQGVVGELHIGGVGLARGYLNRAELTAEKFISNPFSDNPEDRLYKTGDLVRWLPDGNLEYIGRIDHQVKIRGFRIELGEIENTLLSHDAIQESVVIAREDQAGDKRLVAYVVLNESDTDEELKAEQLNEHITTWRSHLSQSLPEYMVPSSFVVLDHIPLTPNGKVDRNALPAPDMSQQQASYVAPSTETEKLLSAIWQDILGLEQVGVTDNFFRLGGHSLLLIQMLSRLQEAGHPTDVRQLFSANNLGELAEQLDQAASQEGTDDIFVAPENLIPNECDHITPEMLSLITLEQVDIDLIANAMPGGASNIQDMYPLAPLQEGILFHHQMSEGKGDPYVMPVLLSAKTHEQRDAFLTALQTVVNRHDVLRTAVLWEGLPQAVQVVCRYVRLPVELIPANEGGDVMAVLDAQMSPSTQHMDITQAPLLRVQTAEDPATGLHYILLKLHHIISDHVGLEIIQAEVQALLQNNQAELASPAPYRDFVAHTRHRSKVLDAEAFFKAKLGSIDEPTAPFNLLDVHGLGEDVVEAKTLLDETLSSRIRLLAQQLSVSPAALFHVGYGLVVAACSGRDDVVFGTVLSGRLQGTGGADRMLGMFINTLPFRLNLTDMSIEESIRHAQSELIDLLPYEQASLALAQQCSGLPSGTPLFSAMLNYRHSSPENNNLSAATDVTVLKAEEWSNYPFAILVDDLGSGFTLTAQVHHTVAACRVVNFLQTAMESLVNQFERAPQAPVLNVGVLPELERHELLSDFNNTKVERRRNQCVHEMFEAQAKTNANSVALVFGDQTLSYGELNNKANCLANFLVNEKGVTPDTLVGVCLDRSIDMIVALLAVLKSGSAYVPLDPDYPESRLEYMLKDASIETVITKSDLMKRTPITAGQALCIDVAEVEKVIGYQSDENIDANKIGITTKNLAYVIYTSGSTGKPKGVMIEHKGLFNLAVDHGERFSISDSSIFLQNISISFDAASGGIWSALSSGATLVVLKNLFASGSEVENIISHHKVTHLMMTSSSLNLLSPSYLTQSLSCVVVGGDSCSQALADRWRSHCLFFNAYGPTENTICSTVKSIASNVPVSIGRPVNNCQAYVVKGERLLPKGVSGELLVGGEGLARGYVNRPELTKEKFIPNPFSDVPNDRLYKTGDLVCWTDDGDLEFKGRLDNQVKIRGYRIELGEIEEGLLIHSSVREAVVLVHEARGGNCIVAYVVPTEETKAYLQRGDESRTREAEESWRTHLGKKLPEYMIPSSFVIVEKIPLTPNGKVDCQALPAPDFSQARASYIAPKKEAEKLICAIWQEVLGVTQIGLEDNFFHLGGHSLLLIQVVARLQAVGLQADVKQLFGAGTLRELARQLENNGAAQILEHRTPVNLIPEGVDLVTPEMLNLVSLDQTMIGDIADRIPGGMRNIQDIYPLAPLQEGILFHHQMSNGGADSYVQPALIAMQSRQKRDEFLQALQCVVDRHDVLRTAILWEGLPEAVQVVCRNLSLSVENFNLDSTKDILSQLEAKMCPTQQFMDIRRAPLLKVELAEDVVSNRYFILLRLHHIISDYVGLNIIRTEIHKIMQGEIDQLDQPTPYREFVGQALNKSTTSAAQKFFKDRLEDISEPSAPFGLLEVHASSSDVQESQTQMDFQLSQGIRDISRKYSVSAAALFHLAYGLVLRKCIGRDDVVFGTVLSGRMQGTKGGDRMLGMFINTLPFRLRLSGESVEKAAHHAHSELIEMLPYEQTSLTLAQKCSGLPSGTPLFSAILNYRHAHKEEKEFSDANEVEVLYGRQLSGYPFMVSVDDFGEGFTLTAQADSSVDPSRIVAFMETALTQLVEALKYEPTGLVCNIDILPQIERDYLLAEMVGTISEISESKCIHEQFEQCVQNNPGTIAIEYKGGKLSYGDLNKKANKLARYLVRQRSVRSDSLVGICLDRSLDMVVALLSVLKAGGAYVPLDPNYPAQRLAYMLEDASLDTVLTIEPILSRIPVAPEQAVCMDAEDVLAMLRGESHENISRPTLNLAPRDLAYVIYTSGSTGKPKGVMIEHRSVFAHITSVSKIYSVTENDKVSQFSSLSFDAASEQILVALVSGCQLNLCPDLYMDSFDFVNWVFDSDVSVLNLPPSFAVEALPLIFSDERYINGSSLRLIVLGGDRFPDQILEPWFQSGGPNKCQIMNAYGPTEACITSHLHSVTEENERVSKIGRTAGAGYSLVLGEENTLVPLGATGELCIGGDRLARGYLNRDGLTSEKFISNPFSEDYQSRLYKTGDLVRLSQDGELEYVGRVDHQVKVRGFRIELGEIESLLVTHSMIQQSVVVAMDIDGDKRLVAYVVLKGDIEPERTLELSQKDLNVWREYLSKELPEYMVPNHFVVLGELPLNPSGKIDRNALPMPEIGCLHEAYVAPETDIEEVLCGIWQDMLGVERVGVTDNFFHLGGNSILLTKVAAMIWQEFSVEVPVQVLFKTATVKSLAEYIQILALEQPCDVSENAELESFEL